MTPVGAGLLFLPLTLALVAGTRAGAEFLHKSDPFGPQIWGHATSALGAIALAMIGFDHGLITIAIPLCVIGLGAGVTVPSMNLSALDSVERERSGLASGILNSARQTGGVIGVALLGALVGGPPTAAGASWASVVAAIALAGASALAARIARQRRRFHDGSGRTRMKGARSTTVDLGLVADESPSSKPSTPTTTNSPASAS